MLVGTNVGMYACQYTVLFQNILPLEKEPVSNMDPRLLYWNLSINRVFSIYVYMHTCRFVLFVFLCMSSQEYTYISRMFACVYACVCIYHNVVLLPSNYEKTNLHKSKGFLNILRRLHMYNILLQK